MWNGTEEIVFALGDADGSLRPRGRTGPKGRLYRVARDTWALERTFDEKQVTIVAGDAIATNGASAFYRLRTGENTGGEYVSAVKDTGRTSAFGAFRFDGVVPAGSKLDVRLSVRGVRRAGHDLEPLVGLHRGRIDSEGGRAAGTLPPVEAPDDFLEPVARRPPGRDRLPKPQLRAPGRGVLRHGPERGLRPVGRGRLERVRDVQRPTRRESSRASTRRRAKRRRASSSGRAIGLSLGRSSDPDGDALVHALAFRPATSDKWIPLESEVRESFYSFDTTSLPDGEYVFRVTAEDTEANPGEGKTASRETSPVPIDNTPPAIRRNGTGRGPLEFEVADAASPVTDAEYSVNAREWVRVEPKDGLSDSRTETYAITLGPQDRGGYLLVRATDAARNQSAASFTAP